MRILVVNNNVIYENDAGLFVFKETGKFLVQILEEGHEVLVFQFRMRFENTDFLVDYNINNRGFKIITVKREKSELSAYLKAFILAIQTIRRSDFIYLFYPGNICIILAVICIILNKPYGFYVRGQKGIISIISKLLYKRAKVIFTISPSFTMSIRKIVNNVETIRPMMEASENDILYNRAYNKKLNYELLYVGRIEKEKGIYELLQAIRELIEQGMKNFRVNIVGDGIDAVTVREMVKKYKLNQFFLFHGTITDFKELSLYYKKADLFILPTYHEGFPRVLYEAMIFGVPIITTFVGGIAYLMKDEFNCYRIEPKDAQSIKVKIYEAIINYENTAELARNATKTIIDYLADKKDSHAARLVKAIGNK